MRKENKTLKESKITKNKMEKLDTKIDKIESKKELLEKISKLHANIFEEIEQEKLKVIQGY